MKLYDNDAYRDEFMSLVYGLLASDGTNDRANQIIDAFDTAPEVEAEPLQPNEPLTLDELREMARSQCPVWCRDTDGFKAGLLCIWDSLFKLEGTPHIWLLDAEGNSGLYDVIAMLKLGAKFYRRRPEEGAK